MVSFTIGHDVEAIATQHGIPYALSTTEITGTKLKPVWEPRGSVQLDNVLIELGCVPATDRDSWIQVCTETKELMLATLAAMELLPSPLSVIDFGPYIYISDNALVGGCMPELDVYKGKERPPLSMANMGTVRTAGGHIHLGGKEVIDNREAVVRALDATLYAWSVDNGITDVSREVWYGGKGTYRAKPYGVEYRALDNGWFMKDKYGEVYDIISDTLERLCE